MVCACRYINFRTAIATRTRNLSSKTKSWKRASRSRWSAARRCWMSRERRSVVAGIPGVWSKVIRFLFFIFHPNNLSSNPNRAWLSIEHSGEPEAQWFRETQDDADIHAHARSQRRHAGCALREFPGTMHFSNFTASHSGTEVFTHVNNYCIQ